MTSIPIQTNLISYIIFIGIFLGLYISGFLISKSLRNKSPNLYMGGFIFAATMVMLEGWLNYTHYIYDALWLTNFSEAFNFAFAPLIYLFISKQLGERNDRRDFFHFIPFFLWLIYCIPFYLQDSAYKFNGNIEVLAIDVPMIKAGHNYWGDPFFLRKYVNWMTILHIAIYLYFDIRLLVAKSKEEGKSIWKTSNQSIISVRNSLTHFMIATLILLGVKLVFRNDVGDYMVFIYLTFLILVTSFQIINNSSYFDQLSSFLDVPQLKYQKSSLKSEHKAVILQAIIQQMEQEEYYLKNNASLRDLAANIHQSTHHVSQVINEHLEQSFFEMIASYRIRKAQSILRSKKGQYYTIEEVAEQVGYNSKSAFNGAFKRICGQTPSVYRSSQLIHSQA